MLSYGTLIKEKEDLVLSSEEKIINLEYDLFIDLCSFLILSNSSNISCLVIGLIFEDKNYYD